MTRCLALVSLLALLACGGLQQMSDLALDASELQGRFKTPMGLNLTNGWLVISIPEASVTINKVPPAQAREFARNVAEYAYTHYRHPKAIQQIGVQFVGERHGRKQVTYLAGSWPISRLSDTTSTTTSP